MKEPTSNVPNAAPCLLNGSSANPVMSWAWGPVGTNRKSLQNPVVQETLACHLTFPVLQSPSSISPVLYSFKDSLIFYVQLGEVFCGIAHGASIRQAQDRKHIRRRLKAMAGQVAEKDIFNNG